MRYKILDYLTGEGGPLRVRGMVTILLTLTICFMYATERAVPKEMVAAWFTWGGLYAIQRAGVLKS